MSGAVLDFQTPDSSTLVDQPTCMSYGYILLAHALRTIHTPTPQSFKHFETKQTQNFSK